MKLTFTLINPPWEDSAIFVERENNSAAWLLDCGELRRLRGRDLMRIDKIFISHTHIDHFCGVDHLLRMNLREDKRLDFYGPPGFSTQLEHKLLGYAWDYDQNAHLSVYAHEIDAHEVRCTRFRCSEGFQAEPQPSQPHSQYLELPDGIVLRWATALHRPHAPCLSYLLEEPLTYRFDKESLQQSGLPHGPWMSALKSHLAQGNTEGTLQVDNQAIPIKELAERCCRAVPGRRLAYITDSIFNKVSVKNFKTWGGIIDELWCEACYRHHQLDLARQYCHFTAKQAARLALEINAQTLYLFHYSRRFTDQLWGHIEEAQEIFANTLEPKIYHS